MKYSINVDKIYHHNKNLCLISTPSNLKLQANSESAIQMAIDVSSVHLPKFTLFFIYLFLINYFMSLNLFSYITLSKSKCKNSVLAPLIYLKQK